MSLFPGIDLDKVLASIRAETPIEPSSKNRAQPSEKQAPVLDERVQESSAREEIPSPSPVPESLPREADGFDWSENAVTLGDLSDGMAALSINPEGAGYLGMCHVTKLPI